MPEASAGPTPSQTVGPFFHDALAYPAGPRLVDPDDDRAIRLSGRVLDGDGAPVPDALVEVWHADSDGGLRARVDIYDEPAVFRGFGRCATDADGAYGFVTVKPAAVPTTDGVAQAPYVAMSVFARGILRRLVTRVYFEDEPAANRADPLLAQVGDRAGTLLASVAPDGYRFDVRMQGDQETVFLDVFAR